MAFLDNSGDIILDAVLTDTGRFRLSQGDGSFKIAQFALCDDEIDYSLYRNKNHTNGAHSSGSAYYDLEILQTPVIEALTNNTSTMKSKLITLNRNNLLYLPVMKVNGFLQGDVRQGLKTKECWPNHNTDEAPNTFPVFVDQDTVNNLADLTEGDKAALTPDTSRYINGVTNTNDNSYILVENGLDTVEIPRTFPIDQDLKESNYIVQIDNRLGKISSLGGSIQSLSFIDDDNVANYYFSQGTAGSMVDNMMSAGTRYGAGQLDMTEDNQAAINGPPGTYLQFKIRASLELQHSTFLFEQLGSTKTWAATAFAAGTAPTVYYIDSTVRVIGATTGFTLDVPIRFVKVKTAGTLTS